MQDSIIKEITVKAPKERVYKAISDANELIKWFPDSIEGSMEVGQTPVFVFEGGSHKASVYIEKATPTDYFSYRWVPGGSNSFTGDVSTVPNTLVEFTLEEMGDETKVTVKESGFSKLPAEVAEKSFSDNSGGWQYMLDRLEKLFIQS